MLVLTETVVWLTLTLVVAVEVLMVLVRVLELQGCGELVTILLGVEGFEWEELGPLAPLGRGEGADEGGIGELVTLLWVVGVLEELGVGVLEVGRLGGRLFCDWIWGIPPIPAIDCGFIPRAPIPEREKTV